MTVILPDDLPAFEMRLDASLFDQITGAFKRTPGDPTLPRFKAETRIDLTRTVSGMRMPSAFDADAGFSGITCRNASSSPT